MFDDYYYIGLRCSGRGEALWGCMPGIKITRMRIRYHWLNMGDPASHFLKMKNIARMKYLCIYIYRIKQDFAGADFLRQNLTSVDVRF